MTFGREHLNTLYEELYRIWGGHCEYDELVRGTHIAIALSDAGRPIANLVDPRVAVLVERHRPTRGRL